jgi:hypothetical protein
VATPLTARELGASRRISRRLVMSGLTVLALNLAMLVTVSKVGRFDWAILVVGVVFGVLAYVCRRDARQLPVWLIVAFTVVMQLPGVFFHPLTSDDAYRYVWDGRVQLAGIDPYRYVPADPALASLRDSVLFPPGRAPRINRPGVHTIYPPVAQAVFAVVALVTSARLGVRGVQLLATAAVIMTTWLLARFLQARRSQALLFGACPAVVIEAGNGAHLDALAALLMFGFGWAALKHRHWLGGVFLALAAGIKLVPMLLLPALVRHGRWRTGITAVTGLALSYLPHVLVVGSLVAGFLPGYLHEEGYYGARRFALFAFLPERWRTGAALLAAVAVAGISFWRSRDRPILQTLSWLYGCSFLIATPIYAWYALPFVVIVIMADRPEWLSVWVAAYVAFVFPDALLVQTAGYGVALLIIGVAVRSRRLRRPADSAFARTPPAAVADRVPELRS